MCRGPLIVSLKAVPAVGVGLDSENECAPAGFTVKLPEVPVAPAQVAESVVLWAS